MQLDFANRHVVVTGGAGALGREVVQLLVDLGATCHVPLRDAGALGRFHLARHASVEASVDVDLAEESQVTAFYENAPGLWASIHCAGAFSQAPCTETTGEEFDRLLRANAWTTFLCSREAVKAIRRNAADGGGGRIVNVAARTALEPRLGAGMVAYTASKAAVAAISQALSEETADEGIWVNAVVPSIIGTEANIDAMPNANHRRWARVEEVASTIVYLASPQNESTRGGLVPVYGRS